MDKKFITIGKINYIAVEDNESVKTFHYEFPSEKAWAEAQAFAEENNLIIEKNTGFLANYALFSFNIKSKE